MVCRLRCFECKFRACWSCWIASNIALTPTRVFGTVWLSYENFVQLMQLILYVLFVSVRQHPSSHFTRYFPFFERNMENYKNRCGYCVFFFLRVTDLTCSFAAFTFLTALNGVFAFQRIQGESSEKQSTCPTYPSLYLFFKKILPIISPPQSQFGNLT